MIKNTFIHISGIGEKKERMLWENGILAWSDYLAWANPKELSLTSTRTSGLRLGVPTRNIIKALLDSEQALQQENVSFFHRLLPKKEMWRLVQKFENKILYLDVETTGLSLYYDELTLIGTFDGKDYRVFVKDHNLEAFQNHISHFSILVSFNGILFDVPFIRKCFPALQLPPVHIDLRFLLRRFGYTGGLKQIEEKTGLCRSQNIADIGGRGAALLWSRYIRGDSSALLNLIEYNIHDTVNLQSLLCLAYDEAKREIFPDCNSQTMSRPKIASEIPVMMTEKGVIEAGVSRVHTGNSRVLPAESTVANFVRAVRAHGKEPLVVGIDPSASEKRATGWAVLNGEVAKTKVLYSNKEIVQATLKANPVLVSIDCPLSLPRGCSISPDGSLENVHSIYRTCERELRRRGISVFWCLLPTMRDFTLRGIALAAELRRHGLHVIESFPGAAQDILRIPRKKVGTEELQKALIGFGIRGDLENGGISHDELDAIVCAVTGYCYITGEYEALGDDEEGYLIVPLASSKVLGY